MHLGHHTRDDHTLQSIFSSIDFVKNKTKRIKYFFSFKASPQSVFVVLYMAQWKKSQDSAEQNLPK